MVVVFNPDDPFGKNTPKYLPDGSVEWTPGQAKRMFNEPTPVSTNFGITLAAHAGKLFCAWVRMTSATDDGHGNLSDIMYDVRYASWQPGMSCFSSPQSLVDSIEVFWGLNIKQPTLVEVDGQLRLIVVANVMTSIPDQRKGIPIDWFTTFLTYDDGSGRFSSSGTTPIPDNDVVSEVAAASYWTPSGEMMYITYQDSNRNIQSNSWNPQSNTWSGTRGVGESTWGAMSLHVRRKQRVTPNTPGELHLIFVSNNESRDLLDTVFNPATSTWSRYCGIGEASDFGVATVGDSVNAYAIYQANNNARDLLCNQFHNGSWQRAGGSIGHASDNTPAVAVLGDVLYLCFNAVGGADELYWDSCGINALMPM